MCNKNISVFTHLLMGCLLSKSLIKPLLYFFVTTMSNRRVTKMNEAQYLRGEISIHVRHRFQGQCVELLLCPSHCSEPRGDQ